MRGERRVGRRRVWERRGERVVELRLRWGGSKLRASEIGRAGSKSSALEREKRAPSAESLPLLAPP